MIVPTKEEFSSALKNLENAGLIDEMQFLFRQKDRIAELESLIKATERENKMITALLGQEEWKAKYWFEKYKQNI